MKNFGITGVAGDIAPRHLRAKKEYLKNVLLSIGRVCRKVGLLAI